MTDQQFLMWIHERLAHVHKENELMDYMHKLRAIIVGMNPKKATPNFARCDNSAAKLREALWPRGADLTLASRILPSRVRLEAQRCQ